MSFMLRRAASASFMVLGLLTACASTGDATVDEGDAGVGSGHDAAGLDVVSHSDTGTPNNDSGTTADTGGGGVCKANCTSDTDCQSTCPAAPNNGVNCCDIGSGVCFASSQSTCPASGSDAGMD